VHGAPRTTNKQEEEERDQKDVEEHNTRTAPIQQNNICQNDEWPETAH
jgi:hypothetical protein